MFSAVAMSEVSDVSVAAESGRIAVRKTYKLYIGGAFPRSESGRSYPVTDSSGGFLANAALASRKDARDAVVAARKAFGGWSSATPYNRGQVLYRVAEVLEGRRAQFASEVRLATGMPMDDAFAEVDAAVDRWVWYAGWADKIAQVRGGANPVAGPYFNFSVPEPTGVVAVLAPQDSSLLGLVSVLAPVIVSGNTAVVVTGEKYPLPAVTLSEVLATSDVPGGVVNVLTGRVAEIAPWLASHMDVNAIDVGGAPGALADDMAVAAAENLKRVIRLPGGDWAAEPGLERMFGYLETKTVWHPMGMLGGARVDRGPGPAAVGPGPAAERGRRGTGRGRRARPSCRINPKYRIIRLGWRPDREDFIPGEDNSSYTHTKSSR